jgi:hypothetical protein
LADAGEDREREREDEGGATHGGDGNAFRLDRCRNSSSAARAPERAHSTANRLGRGAWAVFLVEKSMSDFESSQCVAADLRGLCERVLGGENVWDDPYLGQAPAS